ncbi:MAG: hypothetical protein IJ019_06650 [Alphaproteobacteria bacterium]|nr:hypothetical protein [Alphaproteobacteria bacterium]
MNKYLIMFMAMLLSISAFAQGEIIQVDRNAVDKRNVTNFWKEVVGTRVNRHMVYLSNGDVLMWYIHNCWELQTPKGYKPVHSTLIAGKDYPVGTLIYKSGNNYEVVNLHKVGIYTIKKVKAHDVSSEYDASLNGHFSYGGFLGIHNGSGNISGKLSGGVKTVVNIFFENGKTATIDASKEPIWLDVEYGMKVEHYTYKGMNIYKLL